MPFNWGLLSDQSLANQPPEIRQGLQEQATRQFLLGSILGGGLRSGYAASQAVPEQFQTQVEQRAFDRAVANARRNAMTIESAGPVMPGQNPPVEIRPEAFNAEQFLSQLPSVIAQAGPRAKVGNIKEFADIFGKTANQVRDGLIISPSGNIVGIAPRIDTKEGTVTTGQIVGGQPSLQMAPIAGARSSRAAVALPPLSQGEEYVFDANGNVAGIRNAAGAVQALTEREVGQTAGRVSQTPRIVKNALGQDVPVFDVPPALRQPGAATQATTQPGAQTGQTGAGTAVPGGQQTAFDLTRQKGFETDYNAAQAAQATASSRRQAAEYIYSAADQLDPTLATPLSAQFQSYLRIIPGVGDRVDTFVGNYNLMNKSRAQGILNGFGSIKGNANPQEVRIVENAASNPTQDPRWTTKWISALEIAAADKDEARLNFLNNYQGRPGQQNAEWSKSPDNIRIYSHPMVDRFLREQIQANPTQPVLPAGFKLQQSKQTGQYFIAKPDGSRIPVGQ